MSDRRAGAEPPGGGAPLSRKLGIREASRVVLLSAPEGTAALLEPLPDGAVVRSLRRLPADAARTQDAFADGDVVLLFATGSDELSPALAAITSALRADAALWIAYPKKASGIAGDLSFAAVQRAGLDAGLVDNKSCAVDETWTAVRFVYRLVDRPAVMSRRRSR